jgi:hypothetical protein
MNMQNLVLRSNNVKIKHLFIAAALIILGSVLIFITILNPIIGVGILFAFLIFVLSLIRPALLFTILYPLLISIGQIPFTLGSTTISLERLLVILGGLGVLGGVFVTKQIQLKKVSSNVFFGVLLWLGFYIISGFVSPAPDGPVMLLGYAQKIALAYMVYISINTPKEFSTALKAYVASAIVASLFTVIAYFEYGSLFIIREASYTSGQTVLESVFQGLARAGTGNAMFIWLALLLFSQAESKKSRLVWGMLIFWFGVINLFALRRELLVTIPLGLIFLTGRNMLGNRMLTLFISGFLTVLITLFITFSPEWQERLLVETIGEFSSAQDPRSSLLFKFTPAAVSQSPWLGYGPGNYSATQLRFPETVPPGTLARGGSSPHNAWSATLLEAGIFACLSLCLFLYGLGRPLLVRYQLNNRFSKTLWAFAPLIFLQLLFSMMFGKAIGLSVIWFWFGFLLALTHYYQGLDGRVEQSDALIIRH